MRGGAEQLPAKDMYGGLPIHHAAASSSSADVVALLLERGGVEQLRAEERYGRLPNSPRRGVQQQRGGSCAASAGRAVARASKTKTMATPRCQWPAPSGTAGRPQDDQGAAPPARRVRAGDSWTMFPIPERADHFYFTTKITKRCSQFAITI
jgi:hypothetical protein